MDDRASAGGVPGGARPDRWVRIVGLALAAAGVLGQAACVGEGRAAPAPSAVVMPGEGPRDAPAATAGAPAGLRG